MTHDPSPFGTVPSRTNRSQYCTKYFLQIFVKCPNLFTVISTKKIINEYCFFPDVYCSGDQASIDTHIMLIYPAIFALKGSCRLKTSSHSLFPAKISPFNENLRSRQLIEMVMIAKLRCDHTIK